MSFSLYHGNLRNAFSNPQVWPNAEEEEFTHSSLKNTEEPALNVLLCSVNSRVHTSTSPGTNYPMQIQKLSRFSQACGSCVNEVNYVGFNQPWETLVWLLVCPLPSPWEEEKWGEEDKRLTKE